MSRGPVSGWRRVGGVMAVAAGTILLVALVILSFARSELLDEAERDLTLYLSLRRSTLEDGFAQIRSEMELWSDFGRLKESLGLYAGAWRELGSGAGPRLRRLYVEENPFPPEERHLLNDAGDGSTYSALHRDRQPNVHEFLTIHEYGDLFMVDPAGNVLYTFFKNTEFATNLLDGPWAGTGLAELFMQASQATDRRFVAFTDFAPYEPRGGKPAAFVGSPVMDEEDRLLGVLIALIGADQVSRVMHFTAGMGESGETYLVGSDLLMRSDSRFTEESDVLRLTVDTEPVRRALDGETGTMRTQDYRGADVVAAYGPLELGGVRWAVIADKEVSEILGPARRLRRVLLVTGAAVVLLVGLATIPGRDRPDWLVAPEFAAEEAAGE